MRIWITGANGFTGRYFAAFLKHQSSDVELIGLDIGNAAAAEVDHYSSVDIVDAEALTKLAEEFPPTHVLHCAASVFESDVEHLWEVNVRGTSTLIDSLRAAGLKGVRIVSIGSAAEYAISGNGAILETSSVGPKSDYGKSKLAQSLLALSMASAMEQHGIVARTFNLIGPGTSENLVPGAILNRLSNTTQQSMAIIDAYSSRDFIDIRDAVVAYWQILQHGRCGGVYNVCSGTATTIEDLAGKFVENLSRDVRLSIEDQAKWQARASHVLGSNTKIREDTGWVPSIGIDQSVSDMVREAGL